MRCLQAAAFTGPLHLYVRSTFRLRDAARQTDTLSFGCTLQSGLALRILLWRAAVAFLKCLAAECRQDVPEQRSSSRLRPNAAVTRCNVLHLQPVLQHYRGVALPPDAPKLRRWLEFMQQLPMVTATQHHPKGDAFYDCGLLKHYSMHAGTAWSVWHAGLVPVPCAQSCSQPPGRLWWATTAHTAEEATE